MKNNIAELKPNENCNVCGFIENLRDKSYMQFIVLKDATGKIQITVEKEKLPEVAKVFSSLTLHSVVRVKGKVVENSFVKLGGKEIIPEEVEVLSKAEASPIDESSAPDLKLDYRWIDLRSEKNILIFKIRTELENLMRQYFINHGFIEIHTPKITTMSSEGGAEVFKLDYYGKDAYLTQSPQFYKQMAMAGGFEKVFEIGPMYRAEKSSTNRHTCEAVCLDIEVSYLDNLEELLALEEDWMKFLFSGIKAKYGDEIKNVFGQDVEEINYPFPKITMDEAFNVLKEKFGYTLPNPDDLDTKGEQLICEYAREKFGSEFIFITGYKPEARAFYTQKNDDGKTCKGFDLLYRGIELNSGAIREHRPDVLSSQIAEHGIRPEVLKEYIEFFRYGCPPHGGFGFGIDRILVKMLGLSSNRDVIFLFRGPDRIKP